MPDLKRTESSDALRSKAELRPAAEIVQAADLNYLIHWLLRDGTQVKANRLFQTPFVEERRRALDWLLGDADWNEISLDT